MWQLNYLLLRKNAAKLIPTAKQWAFSAEELKSRYIIVFYMNVLKEIS